MQSMTISRLLAVLVFVIAAAAACSHEGGLYADAKKSWDTPPSGQVEGVLRNRLAHTQHDH